MPKEMPKKQYIGKTEVDAEERTITAVITTDTVDRDSEVMLPKGANLEQYLKNPVVLWAHEAWGTPIAKSLWMKKGRKGITTKMQFAQTVKADEIYELYKGGYLNAFSVGFLPAENGSHPPTPEEIKRHPEWASAKRIYDNWELLEFSAVPVPANPEALATAVKNKELKVSDELKDELDIDEEETIYTACNFSLSNDSLIGKTFDELLAAGCIEITKDEVLKPYPDEHSCRLKPPNYDRYARKNCEQKHDGKCIDVIYGIKDNKSEIQALRFKKDIWTATAAKSVCKKRGGTFEAAKPGKIDVEPVNIKVEPVSIKVTPAYEVTPLMNMTELANEETKKAKGKMYMD